MGALILVASVLLLNNLGLFDRLSDYETPPKKKVPGKSLVHIPARPSTLFGLPIDSFKVLEKTIERGESFSNILLEHGVNYPTIHRLANDYREVFDVRKLRYGKKYALFCEKTDSLGKARYMVYQPNPVHYYVFDLADSASVYRGEKEVSYREKMISGYIESSLYETIQAQGGSPALTMELSTIYAWTIDFFRIKKGDHFKVLYEEKFIDDTVSIGMGRIIAVDFNHGDRSFYSFWFDNEVDNYSDYFDEKGNTLRKAFLKAPLEYSRISSRYQPRRFHPVLKRVKAHLGTDYAAPRGTPIMSTADGEVIAAGYTRGNGNYVKVRHNATYTTQYLHMSKFATGIRKGKVVKQGDVIGYVGSTGLATGPHVCYRFWVNGRQVDPFKQDLPDADPIKEEYREAYMAYMKKLKERLDAEVVAKPSEEGQSLQLASSEDDQDQGAS